MKKNMLALLLVMFCFLTSSCRYFNDFYYMFVKNNTDKKITVRIEEDPEVYSAVKLGQQKDTLILNPSQTKRANIVDNSYFKITVDGKLVKYIYSDTDSFPNNEYSLIGENALVIITEKDDEYFYDYRVHYTQD